MNEYDFETSAVHDGESAGPNTGMLCPPPPTTEAFGKMHAGEIGTSIELASCLFAQYPPGG